MIHQTTQPLQAQFPAQINRLQRLACRARYIGEHLLALPQCLLCGANTLALVETVSLDDSWWHLLPQTEVV